MKYITKITALFLFFIVICTTSVNSEEAAPEKKLTAREIMQGVDDRDEGKLLTQEIEMLLIDKNGKKRKRSLKTFRRRVGKSKEDKETIMFFTYPADIKNTGFLTYDYNDDSTDDAQWLFLPALKKTKRIASSDKSSSFMGSDFSYADMNKRDSNQYDYKILKESHVKGHKVWVLEAIPNTEKERDETGYSKSVLFVRQDNFVVVRGVYWVIKGKRLKYLDVQKLELIDDIWVSTELIMTTKKGKVVKHKTVMRTKGVKFNQDFSPELFTVRKLEKGL